MIKQIALGILCLAATLQASNNASTSSWVDPRSSFKIGCGLGLAIGILSNELLVRPELKKISNEILRQQRNNRTSQIRLRTDVQHLDVMLDDYNSTIARERVVNPDQSSAFLKLKKQTDNGLSFPTRISGPIWSGILCGVFAIGVHQAASWAQYLYKGTQ